MMKCRGLRSLNCLMNEERLLQYCHSKQMEVANRLIDNTNLKTTNTYVNQKSASRMRIFILATLTSIKSIFTSDNVAAALKPCNVPECPPMSRISHKKTRHRLCRHAATPPKARKMSWNSILEDLKSGFAQTHSSSV